MQHISLNLDAKVSELITDGEWNHLVHNIPSTELRNRILAVPINKFLDDDEIIWKPSPSGVFTSNSAYRALSKVGSRFRWYNVVWGKLVQPKHSFLAWQICSNSLQTQDRLVRKGILHRSECCLCHGSRENAKHLFFDCAYTSRVWSRVKSLSGLPARVDKSEREWHNILRLCKGRSDFKEIMKVIFGTTLYELWKQRNDRTFRNQARTEEETAALIMRKVRKHLTKTLSSIKHSIRSKVILDSLRINPVWSPSKTVTCSWERPEVDELVLHGDGAVSGSSFGCGGLIRNHKGEVILSFCGKQGSSSVLEQELMAIEMGLSAAKEINCKRILIASDSETSVNIILGKQNSPWTERNKVHHIRRMLSEFHRWRIKHVYREANRAADILARYATKGNPGYCFFVSPLSEELQSIVTQDCIGTVYHRLH